MVRLRTMETEELSTNLPNELSTPDSRATSDMHSRYGHGDARQQHREVELLRRWR